MGSRLPGVVREERNVDDARLVQPSCRRDPLRRPDAPDVEAVGSDVKAEREEGLRHRPRAASPAVDARLPGAARGRRTGTGATLGTVSPASLSGAGPLRAAAACSRRRKTSLTLSAAATSTPYLPCSPTGCAPFAKRRLTPDIGTQKFDLRQKLFP